MNGPGRQEFVDGVCRPVGGWNAAISGTRCLLRGGRNGHYGGLRRRKRILEFFETTVLLDVLLHHAAGNEVLEFFIRPQTQHLLPAAHGIPQFQALIDGFEQTVEIIDLRLKKGSYEFVSDMIRKTSGEPGSFGGSHRSGQFSTLMQSCDRFREFILRFSQM